MSTASNFISKVNQEFPVPGKDNSSQGFRDNFKNISQALFSLDTELENLKISAVKLSETNDFNNNTLKRAVLQDCSALLFDNTNNIQSGNINLDFSAGHYQKYKVGSGTNTFSVKNWPSSGKYASFILSITTSTSNPTYVDFLATNVYNLSTNALPSLVEQGKPKFFEIWNDGDDTNLYIKEISSIVSNTDINSTNVTATNLTSTNGNIINLTARAFNLGPVNFTTGTNTLTPSYATVVKFNNQAGTIGLLPNRIETTITSNPVSDYVGDTTATTFAVASTDGIITGGKLSFSGTGTLYNVESFTTNTITVSPAFPVGCFSLNETIKVINPRFNNLPQVVHMTTTAPTNVPWSQKGDVRGQIFADATRIYISHRDYTNNAFGWIQAVTTLGAHTIEGANTFNGNITLSGGAVLSSNNPLDSSGVGTGAVIISGGVAIAKKLYVGQATYCLDSLNVSGSALFTQALTVQGNATFNNPVNLNNTSTFNSSAFFNSLATFNTIKVSTINSEVTFNSATNFTKTVIFNQPTSFTSTATFANIVATTGDIGTSLLDSTGISPKTDGVGTLGTSSKKWSAVYATNGTIQTSDLRLKENIQNSKLGLEFINSLRPVSYNIKNNTKKTHYGLIAQEVQETIKKYDDKFAGWVLDYENNPESTQNLIYTEFIAPLIKSVQELSEQNQKLKQELEIIKKNLNL